MKLNSILTKAAVVAAIIVPLAGVPGVASASGAGTGGAGTCSESGNTVTCSSAPTPAVVAITSDGTVVDSLGQAATTGLTDANLNKPIVGIAIGAGRTPDSKGYWLVASDGGIFAMEGAPFYGSMGATHLNSPIVGMAATPDASVTGGGYWLVASDGGVFAFGDAVFAGAAHSPVPNDPAVAIGGVFAGSFSLPTVVYQSGVVDYFGNTVGVGEQTSLPTTTGVPVVAALVNWRG